MSTTRSPFASADPLDAVLHRIRVTGTFYCRSELSEPWGLFMPPMPGCMWFHALSSGTCSVEVDGSRVDAGARSLVLVPHGRGHHLRGKKRAATPNVIDLPHDMVSDRYALLRHGGGGDRTVLVCGVVRLEEATGAELERLLPPVIHVDVDHQSGASWLEPTLQLMAAETRALKPGGETVVTRLSDVLVIQAIRAWLEHDAVARTGWLGALRDPQLGRALAEVWKKPEHPWSLADLARNAAMSRSVFSARFTQVVGEPPMQHVTRVRMQAAKLALGEQRASVTELADRFGYESPAAFSRAFKRVLGVPPSEAKRPAA